MNGALSTHLQLLGLARIPFPPTPDAAAWFQTSYLESELVEAVHCLQARAGFVLLTGEIGTGKSTFLRRLLTTLQGDGVVTSLVFNTFLQGNDLLAAVLADFGLTATGTPARDVETLNHFLVRCWQQQKTCVLMIDDAQNLSIESLELLRLLTNLESGQEKLLQIVLSGQPELRDNLDAVQIRQLTSRICKHVRLDPLTPSEIRSYVEFRLHAAGNPPDAIRIHDNAAAALHRVSGGNPRRIHFIMDRCLYGLHASPQHQRIIHAGLIRTAARESGALPARRRKAFPLAVAAVVLLSACAGLLALLPRGSDIVEANASPAPSTPAATAPLADSAGLPWESCIQGLAQPRHNAWLTRPALDALRQVSDICVRQQSPDRWQISWHERISPQRFADADIGPQLTGSVQRLLRDKGHYDGSIDGRFGQLSQRALARFQQQYQLPATGDLDPLTLLLLDAALAKPQPTAIQTEPTSHGHR